MPGRRALLTLLLLLGGASALACDITRWPSTARLRTQPAAPARVELRVRYDAAPAAPRALAALCAALPAAADDDEAGAAFADGALTVTGVRIPADFSRLDAAVAASFKGARRREIAVAVCLPVGKDGTIAPHVRRSVLELPDVKDLPVTFAEGAARLTFTGDREPLPQLPHRLHLAARGAARQ